MNSLHGRLSRAALAACVAGLLVVAFSTVQAAPVHAVGQLITEDSPAPDDGGGSSSDGGSDPTAEPDPTSEPTTDPAPAATPTAAPTQAKRDSSNRERHTSNEDSESSSDAGGGAGSRPSSGAGGSAGVVGTDAGEPTAAPTSDDDAGQTDWTSAAGWALLAGGLASAVGAFVIYRRDPSILPWRGLSHAQ